ncbi:hypothetical protein ACFL17_09380 [Pseudomonadota bacterium]
MIIPSIEFSHIDGRPRFAKPSVDDEKQIKIAAIDPGFGSRQIALCP